MSALSYRGLQSSDVSGSGILIGVGSQVSVSGAATWASGSRLETVLPPVATSVIIGLHSLKSSFQLILFSVYVQFIYNNLRLRNHSEFPGALFSF